jgi:CxxC-x17-CxxC domain-containing protein
VHEVDDNIGNRASTGPREVREVSDRGRASAGAGGGGPREMFEAVCAQCGAQTRVPFKPVAGRPVYCRECFSSKRGVGY